LPAAEVRSLFGKKAPQLSGALFASSCFGP
jgi:hypothetical protein